MKPDLPLTIYDQRLLDCARIVRETKTPFDMREWECRSAHCAIGDYCNYSGSELELVDATRENGIFVPMLPNTRMHMEAVSEHFGITLRMAERLFGPYLRSDRAEVADRIERFVWERVGVHA